MSQVGERMTETYVGRDDHLILRKVVYMQELEPNSTSPRCALST